MSCSYVFPKTYGSIAEERSGINDYLEQEDLLKLQNIQSHQLKKQTFSRIMNKLRGPGRLTMDYDHRLPYPRGPTDLVPGNPLSRYWDAEDYRYYQKYIEPFFPSWLQESVANTVNFRSESTLYSGANLLMNLIGTGVQWFPTLYSLYHWYRGAIRFDPSYGLIDDQGDRLIQLHQIDYLKRLDPLMSRDEEEDLENVEERGRGTGTGKPFRRVGGKKVRVEPPLAYYFPNETDIIDKIKEKGPFDKSKEERHIMEQFHEGEMKEVLGQNEHYSKDGSKGIGGVGGGLGLSYRMHESRQQMVPEFSLGKNIFFGLSMRTGRKEGQMEQAQLDYNKSNEKESSLNVPSKKIRQQEQKRSKNQYLNQFIRSLNRLPLINEEFGEDRKIVKSKKEKEKQIESSLSNGVSSVMPEMKVQLDKNLQNIKETDENMPQIIQPTGYPKVIIPKKELREGALKYSKITNALIYQTAAMIGTNLIIAQAGHQAYLQRYVPYFPTIASMLAQFIQWSVFNKDLFKEYLEDFFKYFGAKTEESKDKIAEELIKRIASANTINQTSALYIPLTNGNVDIINGICEANHTKVEKELKDAGNFVREKIPSIKHHAIKNREKDIKQTSEDIEKIITSQQTLKSTEIIDIIKVLQAKSSLLQSNMNLYRKTLQHGFGFRKYGTYSFDIKDYEAIEKDYRLNYKKPFDILERSLQHFSYTYDKFFMKINSDYKKFLFHVFTPYQQSLEPYTFDPISQWVDKIGLNNWMSIINANEEFSAEWSNLDLEKSLPTRILDMSGKPIEQPQLPAPPPRELIAPPPGTISGIPFQGQGAFEQQNPYPPGPENPRQEL